MNLCMKCFFSAWDTSRMKKIEDARRVQLRMDELD